MSTVLAQHFPILNDYLILKWFVIFSVLLLRYVAFAGVAYLIFYVWKKRDWFHRKIQQKFPEQRRVIYEMRYSISSFMIIGGLATMMGILAKYDMTAIYTDIAEYGWAYFVFSTLLAIFIHDTYFYWSHRAMHHPKLFKHVHKVHHMSHNPTPWAAFSFHPIEAVVEFGFVPFMIVLLPLHPAALLIFSLYMMTMNVMGHVGFEIFPKWFSNSWLFIFHNTSTHHNMHHKFVQCNYGLYFNIWDRLMKTNHAKYKEHFDTVANRPKEEQELVDARELKPSI